jgi:hypothetical protein
MKTLYKLEARIVVGNSKCLFGGEEWAANHDEAIVKFYARLPRLVREEFGGEATFAFQPVEHPIGCSEASDYRL